MLNGLHLLFGLSVVARFVRGLDMNHHTIRSIIWYAMASFR